MFVTVSGILQVEPWDALEFYLWSIKTGRFQTNWKRLELSSFNSNRFTFDGAYRLPGLTIEMRGVGVYSPERELELDVAEISPALLAAQPAVIRYVLSEKGGQTLVAKTWQFSFNSKFRRVYEWAVAASIKKHLHDSFSYDAENLSAYLKESGRKVSVTASI